MSQDDTIFTFVLMPFSSEFDDIYKLGIKEAASSLGIRAERVDEQMYSEGILARIYNQIGIADIIIADMTGRNANVFYEVGYAHAKNKLCLHLTQESTDIPFDLQHHRHIVYRDSITTLREQLVENLIWAKTEVENYRKSLIRVSTKSISATLEKTQYYATGILDFRLDLFNDSDAASEEIEALYFYAGNSWHITQNGVNCAQGESDIADYKYMYLLSPPRNKIPKNSWLPLVFNAKRHLDDVFSGKKLKNSYPVTGRAILRIVTSSGTFDHQISIDVEAEEFPF
ncbi:hypothetical protein ACFL5Z_03445 [Planctomycetota bacterium]